MAFTPSDRHLPPTATALVAWGYGKILLLLVLVERTLPGVGTLGKCTGIVGVVGTAVAQGSLPSSTMQGNAGMTVGFESGSAMGASNRPSVDGLMAVGTVWHLQQ